MAILRKTILENETYKITITKGFANMILFSAQVKTGDDMITGKVNNRTNQEVINYCISKLDIQYTTLKHGLNLTGKIQKIENANIITL